MTRWIAWTLAFVAVASLGAPLTASQALPPDGAFLIRWSDPPSTKNGTIDVPFNTTTNATFQIGFQPPTRTSSCIGGAFLQVGVTFQTPHYPGHPRVEPPSVTLAADHAPNPTATPAVRWSALVTFVLDGYPNPPEADSTHRFQFRTGTPTVNGGSCTPGALSNVARGTSTLDVLVLAPAGGNDAAPPGSESTPGASSGAVVAALLVALAARRRRRRQSIHEPAG